MSEAAFLQHNLAEASLDAKLFTPLVRLRKSCNPRQLHSTSQHGESQHGTARHSTAHNRTALHSTVQNSTPQHGRERHGKPRHVSCWFCRCSDGGSSGGVDSGGRWNSCCSVVNLVFVLLLQVSQNKGKWLYSHTFPYWSHVSMVSSLYVCKLQYYLFLTSHSSPLPSHTLPLRLFPLLYNLLSPSFFLDECLFSHYIT